MNKYTPFLLFVCLLAAACSQSVGSNENPSLSSSSGVPPYDVVDLGHANHGGSDGNSSGETPAGGGSPSVNAPNDAKPPKPSDKDNDDLIKKVDIVWPTSVQDYITQGADIAMIDFIGFPKDYEEGSNTCCTDFGAASKRPGIDNGLLVLNQILGMMPSMAYPDLPDSANHQLNDALQNEPKRYFLQQFSYTEETKATALRKATSVIAFLKADKAPALSDPSIEDAAGGFWAYSNRTFVLSSKLNLLVPASYANPAVYSADGHTLTFSIDTVNLPVPIGPLVFELPVHHALFSSIPVSTGGDTSNRKTSYMHGKLSGYVTVDSIFNAINRYVSTECSCDRAEADPIFTKDRSGYWSARCNQDPYLLCAPGKLSDVCKALVLSSHKEGEKLQCDTLANIVQNNAADIEQESVEHPVGTDRRAQVWDALSIGYEWHADSRGLVPHFAK